MKILPVLDSGWSPCGTTYPTYQGISWLVAVLCLVAGTFVGDPIFDPMINPFGVAVDAAGKIYVADTGRHRIGKFAPSIEGLITDLIQDVISLNLHVGISNSLDAKLDAVMVALDDVNENNDFAAISKLSAFIHVVEAQRGNQLTNAEADFLIAAAQEIILALGG